MACANCELDKVKLIDIPKCFFQSIREIIDNIGKKNIIDVALQNDRVYYVLGMIVLILVLKCVYSSAFDKKTDYSVWEL